MREIKKLISEAKEAKAYLPELSMDEDNFQLRNPHADGIYAYRETQNSNEHTSKLTDAVKRGGLLEPILVIKCNKTGKYIVVDGHHRFKAYRRAWEGKRGKKIPIRILPPDISTNEARLIAFKENQNDKLPMPKAEKMQAIWSILTTDKSLRELGSCRKIRDYLGGRGLVSHVTISFMLKCYKHLTETDSPTDALWRELSRSGWDDDENKDTEQRRQARVEKLITSLSAAMSKTEGMPPEDVHEAFQTASSERGFRVWGGMAHCLDEDSAEYGDEDSDF